MNRGSLEGALSAIFGRDGGRASAGTAKTAERTVEPHCFDGESDYDYCHYLRALDDVSDLRREGRVDEAEALALWCVEYAEAEQSIGEGVPEWGDLPVVVYRQLADLYRDQGDRQREREVLQRYVAGQDRLEAPVESEIRERLDELSTALGNV